MIKRVNIDMDPIPNGYEVTGVFQISQKPSCKPFTLHNLDPAETGTVNDRYNLQFTLFTIKWQGESHPALVFLKTCLKHRSL
jgi:hypothetical protein